MENKTTIKLTGGDTITLKFKELPEEIDVDRILRIDYANLTAEMVTIPVLMNKIGLMLAELENTVRINELVLKKEKAFVAEKGRTEITELKKGKAATNDEVLEYVRMSPKYDVFNRKLSQSMMNRDVMNSLYWSLKSKQEILQNLSKSITAGDFQDGLINSVMKTINYVEIGDRKPVIK